ncbi:MAG: hypothetical protein LBE72_05330 [Rickettsia sp.]|jgi:hypothetical protein|nr:hypothetical protein [Rickettsia sp.]
MVTNTKKEENKNQPIIKEKSFDELLVETKDKITQKDYYQTEKFPVGDGVVTVHFKSVSHKTLSHMNRLPEDDRIPYLLSQTLYSAVENRLFTFEELNALFEGLGGLTETIASRVLTESGFNFESVLSKNPITES